MNKISAYLTNAKGLGLKFLLLFSFIAAVIFAIYARISGTSLIPYAQSVADQLLPIKIAGGVIVEPVDTVRKALINVGGTDIELPIILDTSISTLDTTNLKNGVYITKSAIYSINRNQVRIDKLQADMNMDLPQGDYSAQFKNFLNLIAIITLFAGTFSFFIVTLLLSAFYAICSYALTLLMKKPYTFDLRMRISSVCLITTYILLFTLGLLGVSSGKLGFFLVVMLLEYFLIRHIPAPIVAEQK